MSRAFDKAGRLVSRQVERIQRRRPGRPDRGFHLPLERLDLVGQRETCLQNIFYVLFNVMRSLIHWTFSFIVWRLRSGVVCTLSASDRALTIRAMPLPVIAAPTNP